MTCSKQCAASWSWMKNQANVVREILTGNVSHSPRRKMTLQKLRMKTLSLFRL